MRRIFLTVAIALTAWVLWQVFVPSVPRGGYRIELAATPSGRSDIEFEITTNLPLPVQVMASLTPKNQPPDAGAIGINRRIGLTSETTRLTISVPVQALPPGDYLAEARFYPEWGANAGRQAARRVRTEIAGVTDMTLAGPAKPQD